MEIGLTKTEIENLLNKGYIYEAGNKKYLSLDNELNNIIFVLIE